MIELIQEKDIHEVESLKKRFPQLLVDFPILNKENNFRETYALKKQKEIIGILILDIIYERVELIQIEILKNNRGQGYGNQLMEFVITRARQKKAENITLEVHENNTVAIHLYQKYGFQKVAIRKKYYHNKDGILMERKMM